MKQPDELYELYDADTADDHELPKQPSRLRTIASLEVVVRDELGTYLLLTYPDYTGAESADSSRWSTLGDIKELGEWTPPYITYNVDMPSGNVRTVGYVRQLFDAPPRKSDRTIQKDLRQFADAIGLDNATVEPLSTVIELKRSYSNPDSVECYLIRRYRARSDNSYLKNLADPEFRKGFCFLPLDDETYDSLPRVYCRRHQRTETRYLSRSVASNVSALLDTPQRRETVRGRAIEVGREHFYSTHEGLILCGDLAGYGRASEYAQTHMGDMGGEPVDTHLRNLATISMTKFFLAAGLYQVHTAGDGFICARPLLPTDDPAKVLSGILDAYGAFLEQVEGISASLREHAKRGERDDVPTLGSRLAIHQGRYSYGRMSLAASLGPSFDGASIIEVARLESGMAAAIKGAELVVASGHAIGISETAIDTLGLKNGRRKLHALAKPLQTINAHAKEYRAPLDVYEIRPRRQRK